MAKKAPYTFPHKSRADMVAYILGRDARSYHYQTFRFVWNIKAYAADFDGASLRKHFPDLDPRFDAEWDSKVESDEYFFWQCCEDGLRYVMDGEWTSYPGSDQGDWEFSVGGRCGGWLILEKWRGRDVRNLRHEPENDYDLHYGVEDNLATWDFAEIRDFYRGLRTADSDFTSEKAAQEVEYQAAFQRECWEDDLREARAFQAGVEARRMESARPDLYGTGA